MYVLFHHLHSWSMKTANYIHSIITCSNKHQLHNSYIQKCKKQFTTDNNGISVVNEQIISIRQTFRLPHPIENLWLITS